MVDSLELYHFITAHDDEVVILEQVIVGGAAEGGASDDALYGVVPSPLAILPPHVPACTGLRARSRLYSRATISSLLS